MVEYLLAIGGAIVVNAPNLVGFAMPLVVEWLNTDVPSERIRRYVAIVSCLIMAVILHWSAIENGSPDQVALAAGIIFIESQTIFRLYFKNSLARGVVQKLVGTKWVEESEVLDTATTIAPEPAVSQ